MAEDGKALSLGVSVAFLVGAAGLVAAMVLDFANVVGRHVGLPLIGGIELVQVGVVLAASASLVGATLARAHAAVHVLTERMSLAWRLRLARVAGLFGVAFFAALFAGGAWMLADTWRGDERTELLGLPLAPFRILWCAACALTAILFLFEAIRPKPPTGPHDVA